MADHPSLEAIRTHQAHITEAIDHEEYKFAKISITGENFIILLNRLFDCINFLLIIFLILFIIANKQNFNPFPFEVNDVNSWLYQIAQVTFIASYWTTNILALRILLIFGFVIFIVEFTRISISIDFLIYTLLAIFINFKQIVVLLYKQRPIIFDEYREQIYEELFDCFMERNEFKLLTKHSLLRDLQKGSCYAHANDKCQNLTILLKGKMQLLKPVNNDIEPSVSSISEEGRPLDAYIDVNEFIDSAEWLLREMHKDDEAQTFRKRKKRVRRGMRFNYSIKAVEDCKYMFWPRELILDTLEKYPDLKPKLTAVLGLDVSHKVFQHNSVY